MTTKGTVIIMATMTKKNSKQIEKQLADWLTEAIMATLPPEAQQKKATKPRKPKKKEDK